MVTLQSVRLLLFFILLRNGNSQACSFQYFQQPPTMLDCDPIGIDIVLQCSTASSSDNVTWYWTQNVCEAGVSGAAILPGDTSDNYQVASIGTNNRDIGFTVSESTFGYYWCEISNAVNVSLRPSTITPVCPPMSSSQQNKCNKSHIRDLHHDDHECVEEDSPTVISRPPLPTSCAGSPTSVTTAPTTVPPILSTSVSSYLSSTVALLQPILTTPSTSSCYCSITSSTNTPVSSTDQTSTSIPLGVFLVVVSITLLVSVSLNIALCYRVKRHTETNEECAARKGMLTNTTVMSSSQVQQRHSDAEEPEMTSEREYESVAYENQEASDYNIYEPVQF